MTRRRFDIAATVLLLAGVLHSGAAQEPNQAVIAAIKAEGLRRSQAQNLFHTLTDVLGPRLTGSPAHTEAARWAVQQFNKWGLANPRLEPFQFGPGWSLERLTVEMISPRYMPLIGYAEAWSPPTSGTVTGAPIYIGDSTVEEIDRMGARLRGAIVLANRQQAEFLRTDRMQPSDGNGPAQTGNPPLPGSSSAAPMPQLLARLQAHRAAVVLKPGAMEHGTVRVQGSRDTPRDAVPSVVLAAEHYNMLVRLVQAGQPIQLRVDVGSRFHESDLDSYNVLAEIPGADPVLREEVVFIGAHLDSWHTATGATDNADGVTAVMEAMRILMAINARPRRTIRLALWSGEEQGLLGAHAYVSRHLPDEAARNRISVYLNDDPGSGATYGFYMQDNPAAKPIFDSWLEPLRELGVRRNVIEGIGSTDHLPFDEAGVPGFTVIKDFHNYDVRTRHTNADLADAVKVEDLRQSAVVMAVVAWQAAMMNEKIPSTEVIMRTTIMVATILTWYATASAETHRFVPKTFYNTFSFAHPPALRIKPGDRVITVTADAGGIDANDQRVAAGPNPQTGPFFIEGAEPGDMLVVTLNRIEPNRATARSATLLAPYTVDPAFLRSTAERQARQETWIIDKAKGVARTSSTDLRPGALEFFLIPMLGCVGTAPRNKEAISTSSPGSFGGNMDYAGMVAGVKVMLPVNEPGALLFIGDGHARQGHGEVVGMGLETSMDVEFTVDLVKKKTIGWPRLENDDYIMALGSERPLLQAFQHATTELLRWLMADYGFDERTASMLMGQAVEYEIANVVDPHFTVVAKLRKVHLARR